MLQFQNIPLALGGVDTKSDIKTGAAGTYSVVENMYMQKSGALKIREGTTLFTAATGNAIFEFREGLAVVGGISTFLPSTNSYFMGLNPIDFSFERPATTVAASYVPSSSTGVTTRGYLVNTAGPTTYLEVSKTTLTPIDATASFTTATASPAQAFSGTNAGVAYTETNTLKITLFFPGVTATLRADASTNQFFAYMEQLSSVAICVSCNIARTQIRIDGFSTSTGALVNTQTINTVGTVTGRPYVFKDTSVSNNYYVVWAEQTGGTGLDLVTYTVGVSPGSTVAAPVLVSRVSTTIPGAFGAASDGNAFGGLSVNSLVRGFYIPTGGQIVMRAGSTTYTYTNTEMVGNAFNVGSNLYLPVVDRTQAYLIPDSTTSYLGSVTLIALGSVGLSGVNPIQQPVTALKGVYPFTGGVFTDRFWTSNTSGDGRVLTVNELVDLKVQAGTVTTTTRPVIIEVAAGTSKAVVSAGGRVYTSMAGNVMTFDGVRWFSTNIDESPTISYTVGGGGSLAAGDYLLSAVYTYIDALGMVHRSPPSTPFKVTSGAAGTITVSVPQGGTLPSTANVELYISNLNTGTLYLQSVAARTVSSRSITTVANIETSTPLYAQGGIIEATSSPVCSTVAFAKNRLWAGGLQDGKLYYTKELTPGEAPSWNEAFSLTLPGLGGRFNGIAEMDDKIIAARDVDCSVVYGQGPDETGAGGFGYQLISNDTGCVADGGIQLTEEGVMMFSNKGIYVITKDLQVVYYGSPVEDYSTGNLPVASFGNKTLELSKMYLNNTTTVIRDSYHKLWSVNRHPYTIIHACDVNGGIYILTSAGVYVESAAQGTDAGTAIPVLIRTRWIPLAGIEGFTRIKELRGLGTLTAAHTITAKYWVDYETTAQTFTLASGTYASDGNMKFELRPAKQKCAAFMLEIAASVTNNPFTLSGFSLFVGLKPTGNKYPATRRGV